MHTSCCICGLVLATDESDYPQWCKDVRALSWIERRAVLSDIGSIDSDAIPFNLPVPEYGTSRYRFHHGLSGEDDGENCCYPFHAICWNILQDIDDEGLLSDDLDPLYGIFESSHYDRKTRCLSWGQDNFLEEVLDTSREGAVSEEELEALDPSDIEISTQALPSTRPMTTNWTAFDSVGSVSGEHASRIGLMSIPTEVFQSILCILRFTDVQSLLRATSHLYREYGSDGHRLPSRFWNSRFWLNGETAFARSIRPSSHSYKDWFFLIKLEMRSGPNALKLRNRKRVWAIGLDLIKIVRTIRDPQRALHGNIVLATDGLMLPTATCLRMEYDSGDCRELKQVYTSFDELSSGTCLSTVTPSYIFISSRRVVSGLTLEFSNGAHMLLGYVTGRCKKPETLGLDSDFLWLVCSQTGFEAITSDRSTQHIDRPKPSTLAALTKWPLKTLKRICLGLDAMRIVRVSIETPADSGLEECLWTSPYPSNVPQMHKKDVSFLRSLQGKVFAPLSLICIEPQLGRLLAIAVLSPLGWRAGITGLRFIYDRDESRTWGTTDDAASLVFFLGRTEQVVKVRIYKMDSIICHIEFFTDLQRTSGLLPPFPRRCGLPLEYVDYTASAGSSVAGFCGCYVNSRATSSSTQLHGFGIIGVDLQISSGIIHLSSRSAHTISTPQDIPLGGWKNHGEQKSFLRVEDQFTAIQASVNTTMSKYRPKGQITGLLFHSRDDEEHPYLLGQWTGAGACYSLKQGEHILDLDVVTKRPLCRITARPQLSQVESITVVTSLGEVTWNPDSVPQFRVKPTAQRRRRITTISWDFNAIFDRVQCSYADDS